MSVAHRRCLSLGAALLAACAALPAAAQSEPFIGQIMCAGFSFAPRGWARTDGQQLPIASYQALFSLLGTTYGGDGRTTFALPDLRGRFLLHDGSGPGLSQHTMGERGGSEAHTLTPSQMPAHTHAVAPRGSTAAATAVSPAGAVPAATRPRLPAYGAAPGDTEMAAITSGPAGGNQPTNHMPPYLVINCFIALEGIFPSRP
jgi:microcystin-dependent protein